MDPRVKKLIGLFASEPTRWERLLPGRDPTVVFLARETCLASQWPLFFCAYELWADLNGTFLDRTVSEGAALARIRILLEIILSSGSVAHIAWRMGDSDRWDDFWKLVHELAVQCCRQSVETKIVHEEVCSFTEKRLIKSEEELDVLMENWKNW